MKLLLLLLPALPLLAQADTLFDDDDVASHVALLGDGVVLRAIEAPVIESPRDWVGRPNGEYRFRFVAGDDKGEVEQLERHVGDPQRPGLAWTRHIGESLIEGVEVVDGQAIRLHTETDLEHGYRVEIHPGVTLPSGAAAGDRWQNHSELTVYALDQPDTVAHRGSLQADHRYVGAYRIRVPAGEFDAVLLEEDYRLEVGPLKVEDRRYVFHARGVGVVAEVEGLRASALIVFRMQSDNAKVLTHYPGTQASSTSTAR